MAKKAPESHIRGSLYSRLLAVNGQLVQKGTVTMNDYYYRRDAHTRAYTTPLAEAVERVNRTNIEERYG